MGEGRDAGREADATSVVGGRERGDRAHVRRALHDMRQRAAAVHISPYHPRLSVPPR